MFLYLGHMNLLLCHVSVFRSYESAAMSLILSLSQRNRLLCHVSVLGLYESAGMSCFCP